MARPGLEDADLSMSFRITGDDTTGERSTYRLEAANAIILAESWQGQGFQSVLICDDSGRSRSVDEFRADYRQRREFIRVTGAAVR